VAARWFLLAILTGSYGAGAFGMLGISPLSPSLVAGFGLTRLQVALLVPSIYRGVLLFALPAGRLADRVGVRPSLLGGLIVGAVGLAVGAAAPAFPAFLFCLFVAGSGWSVVNPALGKAIMDLFPAPERGMAMGIKQMGLTLGGIGAATFAGYAFRPVTAPLGAAVLAFATGIGAYGWVGVFFVISAELGGVRRAGLLSGVAFASIVVGLLIGPAVFGLLLDHWDSYAVPWVIFATLATLVTAATLLAGPAIDRARR
jgi:MFS family permease